ncbi:MAG: ATP-binding protein [Chthoniobacteraceae bacterium]
MRPLSLRTRLGVWAALMLAPPLVVFGCVVAWSVYEQEVDAMERELRVESASVLGRMIESRKTGRVPEELRALIEPFHPYIEVLGADGKPVYRSAMLAGVPGVTDPRESGNARTVSINGVAVRQVTVASDGLAVSLGASLALPRRKLGELLRGYAFATPFLLATFALGASWIARRALRPLGEITARAEQISTSSLDARLPLPAAQDELRRLTEVLNSMMSRLESGFAQVARFSSDASHELRTPLAVLRAELETALLPGTTDETRVHLIHTILDEVRRLSSLVDDLLLLSRSDAGKLELDIQPTDLSRIASAAVEDARLLGEMRGLSVEADVAPGVQVRGDAARLRQVLLNLVDNAVKFNRDSGRLRITLAATPGEARLAVGNTGPGLRPEHRTQIFDRFFRGDPARSRDVAGFGLGLSLTREIMLAHGGRIELARSDEDWTEFLVALPLAD